MTDRNQRAPIFLQMRVLTRAMRHSGGRFANYLDLGAKMK